MQDGYRKIFWGVFIATFSINLGVVNILPAFVGWMVVASGVRVLVDKGESADYGTAKTISYILVGLTLVGGLMNLFGGLAGTSPVLLFYPLVVMVIELILFHEIFEGSVNSLDLLGITHARDIYIGKDRTYIILSGISMILVTVALFLNLETLAFFSGISALVTRVYLLNAIRSLGSEDWKDTDEREENDYDPEHTAI